MMAMAKMTMGHDGLQQSALQQSALHLHLMHLLHPRLHLHPHLLADV